MFLATSWLSWVIVDTQRAVALWLVSHAMNQRVLFWVILLRSPLWMPAVTPESPKPDLFTLLIVFSKLREQSNFMARCPNGRQRSGPPPALLKRLRVNLVTGRPLLTKGRWPGISLVGSSPGARDPIASIVIILKYPVALRPHGYATR